MIPCVRVKDGVTFPAVTGPYKGTIAPAGFVLLAAIQAATKDISHDLTITSGSDGKHSGPEDPHPKGEAYDVRTHDLTTEQKALALDTIQRESGPLFFAFLEDPDDPTHPDPDVSNEHIHCQRKKGTVYPPVELNNAEDVSEIGSGN
jgi:hypothetical protein